MTDNFEKLISLCLKYYRRLYRDGSWYSLEYADEIRCGEEVLIADCPSDDELKGLRIAVYEDKWIPDEQETPVPTGLKQVHLMGTPDSLKALGRYLIAIAETNLPEDKLTILSRLKAVSTKIKYI